MEVATYDAPCMLAVVVVVAADADVVPVDIVAADAVDVVVVGQSQSGKIIRPSSRGVLFTE